jgi:hypothetical protein
LIFSLFKRRGAVGGPQPIAAEFRQQLVAIDAKIAAARQGVARIEEQITRLKFIIAAAAPAAQDLQEAVADDGAAELERYAAGDRDDTSAIARRIAAAESTARAAAAARAGLPRAEQQLSLAVDGAAILERNKRDLINAVMIEHGDAIAKRYRAAFEELANLHDELVGFAQGARTAGFTDVQMVTAPIEAPKFRLPAMQTQPMLGSGAVPFSLHGTAKAAHETFSPYLTHKSDSATVTAAARLWGAFAARLAADPQAELPDTPIAAAVPRRAEPRPLLKRRQKPEPENVPIPMISAPRDISVAKRG